MLVQTFDQMISSEEKKTFLFELQQQDNNLQFCDSDSEISSDEFKQLL